MFNVPPVYPDDDPRSWNYKREYKRPNLHFPTVVLSLATTIFMTILLFYGLEIALNLSFAVRFLISTAFVIAVATLHLKRIIIWIVKCYQRFAPLRIRSMCRYEPSCSEYMIQAVEKYGAMKGIKMGIKRLHRCAHLGGGYDYP